ncbi:MAG: CopG family transcriptional regulator [Fischerella sp.]|jgi:predicted DNA-binding protein|uniref:CopG family ribbon-helix-helix protein n=1 Tax=Fischerella sp. TaxID=1191 RepID=UPI0017F032F7|nr:ribbon-helix-helix domain-containing protein [Fischerella sp.]NWF59458.1 CopG family transcriptional regulator [Fischerella sp.]
MANSPQVSIRIPPETLKRIDLLAQKLYPSRRAGKNPNRSQVILDAIAQYLEQHESSYTSTLEIDEQLDEQPIKKVFQQYPKDIELATQHSQDIEPPIREYIDWWFDYFSYMKKLTDIWFGAK